MPPLVDSSTRPRPESLTDAALLAAVLRGPSVAVLTPLLATTGGLRALLRLCPAELRSHAGLGPARADRVAALAELVRRADARPLRRGAPFRTSRDVHRHFGPRLRDLRVERFLALLLDGKHRVMREELVSQGTLTSSPVHPREVFGPAVRHAAAAVVLVHNHPSGDPSPSADDLAVTRRLVEAGELLGIGVLDHVIVGDGAYTSLADRGLLTRR